MPRSVAIAVCPDPPRDGVLQAAAARLSAELGLPLLERLHDADCDVVLVVTPARCELRVLRGELAGGRPTYVDLTTVDTTSPAGRSFRQPIIKAIGWKRHADPAPTILDATAGFGEDAWLLASFGCRVTAVERDSILAALLRDGLRRAAATAPDAAGRLSLLRADARDTLRQLISDMRDGAPRSDSYTAARPDVVYLDPMFPTGRRALERKPMRVLRSLVGDDDDAGELLRVALQVATRRVVVKRPSRAAPLADIEPTTTHVGKAARYDVYAVAAVSGVPGGSGGSGGRPNDLPKSPASDRH